MQSHSRKYIYTDIFAGFNISELKSDQIIAVWTSLLYIYPVGGNHMNYTVMPHLGHLERDGTHIKHILMPHLGHL